MADIGQAPVVRKVDNAIQRLNNWLQAYRRPGFQDLDLPPFQNNFGVVRVDGGVVTSRSSQ